MAAKVSCRIGQCPLAFRYEDRVGLVSPSLCAEPRRGVRHELRVFALHRLEIGHKPSHDLVWGKTSVQCLRPCLLSIGTGFLARVGCVPICECDHLTISTTMP